MMFNDKRFIEGDQNVQVPAHLNFGKFILDRIRCVGDKVAIENAETGEQLTYKDFAQYAVNLAVSLVKLGIGHGDIVALGSEKRNMFIPTALAIILTGATYTPFDNKSGRAHLKHKMGITQPKYIILSKSFWEQNHEILQTVNSLKMFITLDEITEIGIKVSSLISTDYDVAMFEPARVVGQLDTAFVLYSSGTTGMPKGVQLTHLNCILSSLPHDFKDETLETAFVSGEWYHNYDTFMTFKFLSAGRKLVYANQITPEIVLKCFEQCKVNIALVTPSMINWLTKITIDDYNLSSVKTLYSRSSPLHVKTICNIKNRFPFIENILQGYGMTEAGEPTSENWSTSGLRAGSVGCASPGITLKVVDPNTQKVLGPNEKGEICLRGPVFMKGYIAVESSSYLDEDGFFKTGDLGYYDNDGYFYIVDRLKEIISYCGHKVAPLELETILQLHVDVREAGVVGMPVQECGEEPMAFVVLQANSAVTAQELIDYVALEVPPYMQLRGGIRFISHLPRNPRGKVLRSQLRKMLKDN